MSGISPASEPRRTTGVTIALLALPADLTVIRENKFRVGYILAFGVLIAEFAVALVDFPAVADGGERKVAVPHHPARRYERLWSGPPAQEDR